MEYMIGLILVLLMAAIIWWFRQKRFRATSARDSVDAGRNTRLEATGWMLGTATRDDGALVFRFLGDKPNGWDQIPLSEEISVTWTFDGMMPDKPTKRRMDELEEILDDNLQDAELVLVITGRGRREWCFYTKSYESFIEQINDRLSGHPRYPIVIEHSHDPVWQYWHLFVDRLLEAEEVVCE